MSTASYWSMAWGMFAALYAAFVLACVFAVLATGFLPPPQRAQTRRDALIIGLLIIALFGMLIVVARLRGPSVASAAIDHAHPCGSALADPAYCYELAVGTIQRAETSIARTGPCFIQFRSGEEWPYTCDNGHELPPGLIVALRYWDGSLYSITDGSDETVLMTAPSTPALDGWNCLLLPAGLAMGAAVLLYVASAIESSRQKA